MTRTVAIVLIGVVAVTSGYATVAGADDKGDVETVVRGMTDALLAKDVDTAMTFIAADFSNRRRSVRCLS